MLPVYHFVNKGYNRSMAKNPPKIEVVEAVAPIAPPKPAEPIIEAIATIALGGGWRKTVVLKIQGDKVVSRVEGTKCSRVIANSRVNSWLREQK